MRKVAVVAAAQTELRTAWRGAQHVDLISAVVSSVFKGTGLTIDDVDFVIDSGSDVLDGRSISNCGFLGALGAHHKEEARVEEDGLFAAMYGVNKIRGSDGGLGLIVAYSKPSESSVPLYYNSQVEPFYQRPVGFGHYAASGFQAQRYLAGAGLNETDLAALVSTRWAAAAKFGGVEIDKAPSADDVLASADIALPLKELMMARPRDGAVAVLVASDDIARRASRNPVWITGMGTSMDAHAFAARSPNKLDSCEAAAKMALKKAGWSSVKPSIAEISSSTAVTELMVLEALGIAGKNKGLEAANGGGKSTINFSGGSLPADPIMATGLFRLAHAFRQMSTPEAFGLNAPNSAIVHAANGVGMQSHCVFTLEV